MFNLQQLDISEGLLALVGRNGSGKSSFIRSILNEFEEYSGEIYLKSVPLRQITKSELAEKIAVVYSKVDVFGDYTVEDILKLGRLPYQNRFAITSDQDNEIIARVANDLGIKDFLSRKFTELSDGEKQLVMIGRAFVQDTDLILMDEPTAFLDLVNRSKLIKLLSELAKNQNKLILFSTHDIDLLDRYCSSVLLIDNNELIELQSNESYINQIKSAFKIT